MIGWYGDRSGSPFGPSDAGPEEEDMKDLDVTYIIRTPEIMERFFSFVRANCNAMIASGHPMLCHVMTENGKRSLEQNKKLWALMQAIAENSWLDGKQFSKNAWAEFFRREFLPMMEGPHGDYPVSTTSLTVSEMSEYLERIQSYAAGTLGLEL